jgi:glycine/D-amino acid oxidase-like deaminating enzyme
MDGYRRCPNARQLEGDQSCDTVVVGAAMAGISTAYELAIEGQKVVVIDRGAIAGGVTARTSAHLAPLCDDLTSAMIKVRGEDISRAFYESQAAAVDASRKSEEYRMRFPAAGWLSISGTEHGLAIIDDELEAVRKVGAPVHRIVGVEALAGCERQHALRYPRQGTFHPLKYLQGLAAAIEAKGGLFYADTVVRTVEEQNVGSILVKTDRGNITASAAVVATNSPIVDMVARHTKMAPYRTYVATFEIRRGALPDVLYWDTLDPYHYVRLQPGDGQIDYVMTANT